ncbi:TBC1 domain family member [Trifolium pratense]|uniref:TBC1 domain family member n=1 Tax=Trifolium pratense TaxID=57577 RepID=A0A2K3NVB8_TRIPR|nr:TBC1 domain family member [Trifolium pratense]
MPPALLDPPLSETSLVPYLISGTISQEPVPESRLFEDLRGLRWRINLGVLPPCSSLTSIDDLRRATANSRRRYASLRGQLLVDPHITKDGSSSPPNLVMDNPLSQNPRMHELLAPLFYVLQDDVEHHSEVRKLHEDHFTDRFDGLFCQENDISYSFDFIKSPDLLNDEIDSHGEGVKIKSLDELDPKIQTIVLLSDAYGAEGELGIVLSEKFIEHDAYCMFEALMNGARGSVAMADFFSYSPVAGSHTGLPPVIEASAALYHLLSHVDSSLYSHLVELGVEPQYFALRWLRVLFGREFSLDNLLIIWDEIFLSDNSEMEKHVEDNADTGFRLFHSSRGRFISAIAVAMLLHIRSSLLATENPTTCLQRLLSFPEDTDIKKLIEKAKSLQTLALSSEISSSTPMLIEYNKGKSVVARSISIPCESGSPKTPNSLLPDNSYWEEKWRVVHSAEELKQDGVEKQVPSQKKRWTEKVKLSLKRTESEPSSSTIKSGKKESKASVNRSLLEDLSKKLGSEGDTEKLGCHEVGQQDDGSDDSNNYDADDRCLSKNISSENSFNSASPPNEFKDLENENISQKSSVGSNLSVDEINEISHSSPIDSPLPISDHPENNLSPAPGRNNDSTGNLATISRDIKLNKFQWLWKFGRNKGELLSEKRGRASEPVKPTNNFNNNQSNTAPSSTAGEHCSSVNFKGDSADQNVMGTLRNIGQSMLEHIQVIESAFQHERGQGASLDNNMSKNVLVGKGQVTAMSALTELRKISNLLSEM